MVIRFSYNHFLIHIIKYSFLLNLFMSMESNLENIKELNLENIEEVLSRIRPYLQIDGGDVEAVSIDNDSIVKVRLLGSCNSCPLNLMTLRAGIERTLMLEFPQIIRIESVN